MLRNLQGVLRRFGYQLVRHTQPAPRVGFSSGDGAAIPESMAQRLRVDHPELVDLKRRYSTLGSPLAGHAWWTREYIDASIDLRAFRGDNAYVWQKRHLADGTLQRYFLYATDVQVRDRLGLFSRLEEDGAFGCWTFRFRRFPCLSRDLIDSINEINFLDRHCGITMQPGLDVLDIGAGYGRLAHRMSTALPNLRAYYCVDAIPESTFVCEAYLAYRGCDKARVIPADRLDELATARPHVAVNIHSFSEMSLAAVDSWLDLVAKLETPWLLVVPNDGEALLTMEHDGTRRDFWGAIAARGYRLAVSEPVIADDDVRALVGVADHFLLFRR